MITPEEAKTALGVYIDSAVELARDNIPDLYMVDDALLKRVLLLCARSGGLYVDNSKGVMWAYFKYGPALKELVQGMRFDELAKYDLSEGPFRHYCLYVDPDGYRSMRQQVRETDCYIVTAHRWHRGEWRWFGFPTDRYLKEIKHVVR